MTVLCDCCCWHAAAVFRPCIGVQAAVVEVCVWHIDLRSVADLSDCDRWTWPRLRRWWCSQALFTAELQRLNDDDDNGHDDHDDHDDDDDDDDDREEDNERGR
eukprot:829481-Rhodomonas_salina.2